MGFATVFGHSGLGFIPVSSCLVAQRKVIATSF